MQWREESVGPPHVGMPLGITSHNNYFKGGIRVGSLPPSVGLALESHRTWRRDPWEESAPRPVVAQSAGRHAVAGPEAQPGLHVCFGHPHALTTALLREHHDVRHASQGTPVVLS